MVVLVVGGGVAGVGVCVGGWVGESVGWVGVFLVGGVGGLCKPNIY